MHSLKIKLLMVIFSLVFIALAVESFSQVTVKEEMMTIPTYLAGDPDPNPVFFNGRRYQGAQGRVYPYPLTHNLTDSLADRDYHAVIIENEHIEVCILPELGGRIHYAKDKSNGYYFLYHNRVIKPALIGMTGAWISGGVEWNIPHHHRASSFYPVDYAVKDHPDGSKTVWVGETEWRHRTRWMVGITLHPGSTLMETTVRVFNNTPVQNSVLVWANAATHANTDYQIFFPPKTRYATFHRKNQFSEWPVSFQHFDGADYTEGVDVSRWVNHIKSTSFFEWGNNGNFVAGIDHGASAGTVIFGDKYVNPGKKLWSWGNNPSGAMWDRLLTDEDGPYVELMFGSFSDNQPDYSWMQAMETKKAVYFFAPLRGLKGIKSVNENAVLDLRVSGDSLFAAINVTSLRENAVLRIFHGAEIIFEEQTEFDPATPRLIAMSIDRDITLNENDTDEEPGEETFRMVLEDQSGRMLASYVLEEPEDDPMPEPVSSPLPAAQIGDADSLYYSGLRFEQFHDPYFMPEDYYLKAIEINSRHVPALTRLGILSIKSGDFSRAAGFLESAVRIVTSDYTVAENAAPLYYLALAYDNLGREAEAYSLFYRASWDNSFISPARYRLALIDSRRGEYGKALEHLDYASAVNRYGVDIAAMQISLSRLAGDNSRALEIADQLLEFDPLNFHALYERFILTGYIQASRDFTDKMRGFHENYLELATVYGNAGLYEDALNILEIYNRLDDNSITGYPIVYYLMGHYQHLSGNSNLARQNFNRAAGGDHRYCFPFRFESAKALETALAYNDDDALAWYLTGNIYYDHQPGKAMEAWEKSVSLGSEIPVLYRNLAFAYANKANDAEAAIRNIEIALELDPQDARYYYEYDLYRKSLLAEPLQRLEPFTANHDVVVSDQISIFPYAELLTVTGNLDEAIRLMQENHFHRWEGGESIYLFWLYAHLMKAQTALGANNPTEAGLLVDTALSYPPNLQSVSSAYEPIAWYFRGLVAENLKMTADAESYYLNAVRCRSGAPECDYFAARAYERMKKGIATQSIFESMIKTGEKELLAEEDMDFFDPFARVRSKHEIQANAYLRIALGYQGLGDRQSALEYFGRAREHNPSIMSLVFR